MVNPKRYRTVRGQKQFWWRDSWRPVNPNEPYKSPEGGSFICPVCKDLVDLFYKGKTLMANEHKEPIRDKYGNIIAFRKCPVSGRRGGIVAEYVGMVFREKSS